MGTLSIIIRIIKIVWACLPFITTVMFDDRPIKTVLRENLAFTIVFVLFIIMTIISFMVTEALGLVSSEHIRLEEKYEELETITIAQRNLIRTQRKDLEMCVKNEDYDPYDALRRLND